MLKVDLKRCIYRLLIIILCSFTISILECRNVYTAPATSSTTEPIATTSQLDKELSQTEADEIMKFVDLQEMVGQIFEINTNMGTNKLSDPISLMYELIGSIFAYWDGDESKGIPAFHRTSIYHLLVGLALIFLVANFSIKIYEESSAGIDLKINSNMMIKKFIQFIFAILVIFNLKTIVYFILAFFRFVLKLCMHQTSANILGTPDNIDILNPQRIAYEILKQHDIVEKNTLLEDVVVRSVESSVRSQYMIPWVCSWLSKLALVIVVFMNSIKLMVHCAFYIVTVGDFFNDVRKSKFLEYTKMLFALVIEQAVIVVVLYISNLLLNPYLYDLLIDGTRSGGLSYLTLAMIFTGVSMSKVFVIISSNQISKCIVGVA